MNLTKGKIVAGERLSHLNLDGKHKYLFTVETEGPAEIVIGAEVTTFALKGFNDSRLQGLLDYLLDRPCFMDEKEVTDGIIALKSLLRK